jgi:hypothetical protein
MADIQYGVSDYINLDWSEIKGTLPANHFLITEKIISDFLIPDNISPNKFINNYAVAKLSMGELLMAENKRFAPFKKKITESLNFYIYENIVERPLGFPTWFISCYPDIVRWIDSNEELVLASSPFTEFDTTCLDIHKYLKTRYLRQIVNFYITKTNSTLECKIDTFEEHEIKVKKNGAALRKAELKERIEQNKEHEKRRLQGVVKAKHDAQRLQDQEEIYKQKNYSGTNNVVRVVFFAILIYMMYWIFFVPHISSN